MHRLKQCMLFALLSIVLFTTSNAEAKVFSDTRGHWAASYIDQMSDKGFFAGYANNTFRPDDLMSRVEFYALINAMAGLNKTHTVTFEDVSTSDWYYTEVAKAIKSGYLTPTTGRLNPNNPIARQDVMAIIGYMYKLTPSKGSISQFSDSGKVNASNAGYVGALVKLGVVSGNGSMLYPNNGITRAEVAKILFTMMDKYGLPQERVVADSKIKFGSRSLYN
ncbi:S-layer homology domain-containing protein [Peptoniphilus equinus]|uniref:S-layer homology domain-containing protein n=1 Tax=Peptoniphilus equinus TaxID=3016343 RepID=A0ABY7QWN1_9FIRM|nr:S-layer homology domain-containing protein [Peptoniphilus equinus]WBW50504.1 S-layer homology domain-containing protein [Peptoniphilus equinus]